jgi:hypothetical protein
MVKRQTINKTPETQRLTNKKTFQDENIIVQPEKFNDSNAILAEQKIKSPIKSPLRKKNTNINVVTFNPASKTGKLSFLRRKLSKNTEEQANESIIEHGVRKQEIKNVNSGFETDDTLPGPSSDERDHSLLETKEGIKGDNLDERVEEDDILRPKIEIVPEEPQELEKELDWIEQDAKRFQKALDKQCNNCNTKAARWYCHGCNFSFCIHCHQNIHKHFVQQYYNEEHVVERIDGFSLECSFCRKTAFDLNTTGYTSYQNTYKKKYDEDLKEGLRKGEKQVVAKLNANWAKREKEKKRTLRDDVKETELTEAIAEMDVNVRKKVLLQYKTLLEPFQFTAMNLAASNVDQKNNAAFKYDFTRQTVICKSCVRFMNTNPRFKCRSIQIEAYAAPTPYLDPVAIAGKILVKIKRDREARIAAAAMAKADKTAEESNKKKSSFCVVS